jgi:hypothetical protein
LTALNAIRNEQQDAMLACRDGCHSLTLIVIALAIACGVSMERRGRRVRDACRITKNLLSPHNPAQIAGDNWDNAALFGLTKFALHSYWVRDHKSCVVAHVATWVA